jgi:hypothetical protein
MSWRLAATSLVALIALAACATNPSPSFSPAVHERVASERARYLAFYRATFDELLREKEAAVSELLIESSAAGRERPYRLLRLDALYRVNGEARPVLIGSDVPAAFDPIEDGALRVAPFLWNACELKVDLEQIDVTALFDWHARWIDEAGERPPDASGFDGVIHSLGEPERHGGEFLVLVDLGSAPPSALAELVELFDRMGARQVQIGIFP